MQNSPSIHLSVISPVYGAEQVLDELVQRISNAVGELTENYEIILVDDCGPDNSWDRIQTNCLKDSRVKGIKLSRNFGQHYAISAGLDYSQGEWVVVMDCDLQDQPEEIPKLYYKALEGYDLVLARRFMRQDSVFKKWRSQLFYVLLSYLSGVKYDSSIANFGIYHKKVVQSISSMKEPIRYFPAMVKWVGFQSASVNVEHAPRSEGKSNYNFSKLLRLALDIVLAYSDKPLRLTIKLGLFISAGAILFSGFTIIRALQGKFEVLGYASIFASIWFLAGLIIFILGIIGLYLGKTFQGVKNRPIYIIDEITDEKIN